MAKRIDDKALNQQANSQDLQVKVASKEEVLWSEMAKRVTMTIEAQEKDLKINKAILEMCTKKLQDEQTNSLR